MRTKFHQLCTFPNFRWCWWSEFSGYQSWSKACKFIHTATSKGVQFEQPWSSSNEKPAHATSKMNKRKMQSCTLKSVFTKLLVKNTNLCLWKDSSLNLGPGLITLDIDSSAKDLHHCWGTASRRLSTHPQLCNMETCLQWQPLWNGNLPEMGTSLKWKPAYEDKHRLINLLINFPGQWTLNIS